MALFGKSKKEALNMDGWGLDQFSQYMEKEKRGGNSALYQNIQQALNDLRRLQQNPVSEQSAKEVIEAKTQLARACDAYLDKRSGAVTDQGKERLDVIRRLGELNKEQNLDQFRDLRTVREHAGKTWEEAMRVPVAEANLDQNAEVIGAGSSIRYKLDYQGRTGFFTESTYAIDDDTFLQEKIEKEQDPKIKAFLQTNAHWMLNKMDFMDGVGNVPTHDELKTDMKDMSPDAKTVHACYEILMERAKRTTGIMAGRLEYDGSSVSDRNIATSRMAALLGIDSVAAHSERMVVWKDGRRIEGCFMEMAVGIGDAPQKETERRLWAETELSLNKSLNQDLCNLEIFDFICAQKDRHAGNIFYKIGDMGPNGMRNVIGLQGIDNDLAFSTKDHREARWRARSNALEELTFIDKGLAERVRGLNRRDLEYAVGDLLSKEEIDALEGRVNDLKQHFDNMIELEGDEWKLDKFDVSQYPADLSKSGLDKQAQLYIKGVRELDEKPNSFDSKHRTGLLQKSIGRVKGEYLETRARTEYIAEGVKDLFAEAEGLKPERKGLEDIRREVQQEQEALKNTRVQGFAQEKEAQEKQAAQAGEKAAPKQPERMSFKELSDAEKGTKVRLGAHRDSVSQKNVQKEAKEAAKGALQGPKR